MVWAAVLLLAAALLTALQDGPDGLLSGPRRAAADSGGAGAGQTGPAPKDNRTGDAAAAGERKSAGEEVSPTLPAAEPTEKIKPDQEVDFPNDI